MIVGPIAGILVEKASKRASSRNELYSLLAQHIEKDVDRERFLAMLVDAPEPSSASGRTNGDGRNLFAISSAELASIAGALTHFLGPIAPIVAKRESRASTSLEELRQRLAAMIPSEDDRAEFLRRLEVR